MNLSMYELELFEEMRGINVEKALKINEKSEILCENAKKHTMNQHLDQ